jgi:hypothetical protein
MPRAKAGAAAAQEGAKWERRQHKRAQNGSGGSARGSKRGSGGSTRWSKMGAAAAQEGAKWERRQHKREQKREQIGSGGSTRGSKMGAAAAQEGAKAGAGCGFPVWFPRLLPLSAGVLRCAIAQERHAHFYMPLAVDRSRPVDVRYLRLSSRGLCLADHVLSQLSPSPQSGASIPVCYLSCHVFSIANCRFSQPTDALHWLCARCASLCRRGWAPAVMRWISGFLWAFRRVCRGGDEVDFWVFAGVPAGVPRR